MGQISLAHLWIILLFNIYLSPIGIANSLIRRETHHNLNLWGFSDKQSKWSYPLILDPNWCSGYLTDPKDIRKNC